MSMPVLWRPASESCNLVVVNRQTRGRTVSIEVRLLGRFVALREGEEIPPGAFRQRLVRSLVRILLSRRGEFVSGDFLTEALWPRRPPADPRANLRGLVTLARHAFADSSLLQAGPGG